LLDAGESLAMYDIGLQGMPLCECNLCHKLTESDQFTWSQDGRDSDIEKRERATIFKPKCRFCKGATSPVVCDRTKWPHFCTLSISEQLKILRKHGWLVPDSEAQLAKWREKIANGELWFT
jgi:hypothetical protein